MVRYVIWWSSEFRGFLCTYLSFILVCKMSFELLVVHTWLIWRYCVTYHVYLLYWFVYSSKRMCRWVNCEQSAWSYACIVLLCSAMFSKRTGFNLLWRVELFCWLDWHVTKEPFTRNACMLRHYHALFITFHIKHCFELARLRHRALWHVGHCWLLSDGDHVQLHCMNRKIRNIRTVDWLLDRHCRQRY